METREKIRSVFENYVLMRIASIDENGLPKVRSVDFVADKQDESIVYFMSYKLTDKVKELNNNNNVHIVVDQDAHSMEELAQVLYVKGSGKAYELQTQEEMQMAMGLLLEKYPYLSNMPGDPSMMTMFRVELDKVKVTDNKLGFGYTEEISYR